MTDNDGILDKKNEVGQFRRVKGNYLCTITLNYCTAVSLIANKILIVPPKPEVEEPRRQRKKHSAEEATIGLTGDD